VSQVEWLGFSENLAGTRGMLGRVPSVAAHESQSM